MPPKSSKSWSDWVWDKDRRRYYRYRYNSNGQPEYEWDQRDYTQQQSSGQEDPVANVAERLGKLPLADPTDDEHGAFVLDNASHYPDARSTKAKHRDHKEQKEAKEHRDHKDKHRPHRKDKEYYDNYDYDYDDSKRGTKSSAGHGEPSVYYSGPSKSYARHSTDYAGSSKDYHRHTVDQDPDPADYTRGYTRSSQSRHSTEQAPNPAEYARSHTEPSADYSQSRHSYYQPTQATYGVDEEEYDEEEEDSSNQRRHQDVSAAYTFNRYSDVSEKGESSGSAYGPYEEPDDERSSTPRPFRSATGDPNHLSTDYEPNDDIIDQLDQLDPRYHVQPSYKFQPGEIFLTQWSEPLGTTGARATAVAPSVSDRRVLRDRLGTDFYVGFRRFIVIANDEGHSTCVPILTYGGKACKKSGIKPRMHGIIYQKSRKPRTVSGEPDLGFKPVRADITEEGQSLSKESRVNYAKLMTVEHNVRVFFIGHVLENDFGIVQDAVNKCWDQKGHKRKHNRHRH